MTKHEQQIFLAKQMNAAIRLLAKNLEMEDSERMMIADMYPDWEPQKQYRKDEIVKYGLNADNETQLWRVVTEHTSQASWTPSSAPSLFSKIGFTESGTPIWTQPLGAHDAYQKGDKVSHNGKIWESDVNGNVWQPGAYGWTEVK